jgi:amino acid transporter
MFLGFEATAVFRDEVRNPDKTIPRATYGAVTAIGLLQALSSYSLLIFYGDHASAIAAGNPTSMFPHAIGTVISPKFVQVTTTVVVLSQFAANISVHNVAARYFHSLACNGALPRFLAKVHTRHNSPYRASALVAILVAFTLVPYAGLNADPAILYSQLIAVGLIGLMCLMTLVSLACFGWFLRTGRPANVGIWRAYVAPLISFAGLGTIAALAYLRFNLAFGGQAQQNNILFGLLLGAFAGGLGAATYLRIKRPTLFASFGGIDSKASDPNDRIPAMTSL